MHARSVIKKLHYMLTAVLLLLVGGYTVYHYFSNIPPQDVFVSKQKLSERLAIRYKIR